VSGLLMRRVRPLALVLCADRVPIVLHALGSAMTQAGCPDPRNEPLFADRYRGGKPLKPTRRARHSLRSSAAVGADPPGECYMVRPWSSPIIHLVALLQVILIDITLAGDNAIVVGLAASRVASDKRSRVMFWGIAGAVVLRVLLAAVTLQLIAIVGLTLAGGILLLWVCWKIARELRTSRRARSSTAGQAPDPELAQQPVPFWSAVPTHPCRSITYWQWQARPKAAWWCSSQGWPFRSR
jgi:hypothetical protein